MTLLTDFYNTCLPNGLAFVVLVSGAVLDIDAIVLTYRLAYSKIHRDTLQ
jgi:hypothetical protein